jgi:peptide deformylase
MTTEIIQLELPTSILRQQAQPLTPDEIKSEKIQHLITEMKDIMRNAPGVGLAAPQIGVSIQLAVIEDNEERTKDLLPEVIKDRSREVVKFHAIINPVILKYSGEINYFFEACLSIKNRARVTPRHDVVQVQYLDQYGQSQMVTAKGWYARILQHEIDHLNGKLYIDIADERTEMNMDEEYRKKWMNAMQSNIVNFYHEKCCGNDNT